MDAIRPIEMGTPTEMGDTPMDPHVGTQGDRCQADGCGRRDAVPRSCGHTLCAECFVWAPFREVDGRQIQCPICLPRPA